MLILITGVPGSGKTLYAVDLLEKYRLENVQAIKEGREPRPIYSDIDGLTIDGVETAPNDWRDCPDGSIVFYDECQQKFGPDGQGRSSREDIQEFETHRHRGFDIILITQHPKLLHAHIRRLVGRHYHVFRMYGTQNAKVFARDGQIDIDKTSQLNQQDNFIWSYPKKHFDKYKSATLHTHKATVPKWIKRSMIGLLIIVAIMFFLVPKAMPFFKGESNIESSVEPKKQSLLTQPQQPVQSSFVQSASPVACISNFDDCSCYGKSGHKLQVPYLVCKKYTEGRIQYLDLKSTARNRAVARNDS